jgi:hypothetical protein
MKGTIFGLINREIKYSIVIGVFTALLVYFVFGTRILLSFSMGFIIGCLNFVTLTYGINFMFKLSPQKAKGAQYFTFTGRYIIIGIIFSELILHKSANIFALTLGFIIINISIRLSALIKCTSPGKGV